MARFVARFVVILFLMIPWMLFGQSVIVGRVVTQNGNPVENVSIYSPASNTGTLSDSLGYFMLRCKIPCILEFSHINYLKQEFSVTGNSVPFSITMRNQHNNMEEVVVKGRPAPGYLFSSRSNIDVIPSLLGEQDILKYLATTPGIIAANALDPGIYVRGGNSYENCFLVDDMEIAPPDHLTGVLSTFDPYVLGSTSTYKSGHPARYSGYLSSYINMRPDPGNKQKYEGEATVGLISSALKVKGPVVKDHTSFSASARTSYLQSIAKIYNRSIAGQAAPNYMPEYSFNDITANVNSKLSEKWDFSAFGLFSIDVLSMKLNQTEDYKFNWHTFSANTGVSYVPDSQSRLFIKLGMKSAYSIGGPGGISSMRGGNRHRSFIGKTGYSRIISEKIRITAGGRIEKARLETANRSDYNENILIRNSDDRYYLFDIYSDININLNKHIKLYGGVNYQYYSGNSKAHTISPRARLTFSNRDFSVWADYSKTAQYLSLYPYFAIKTPVDIWYPLGKNTRPAICHHYSLGANQNIGNHTSFYIGFFYKDIYDSKDFLYRYSIKYAVPSDNMIQGKGYAKGLECSFALTVPRTDIRVNYTLSESKRKFSEINDGKAFNPPYDVKHSIVVTTSFRMTRRLSFNALWTFASGVYTTFPAGTIIAQNITNSGNTPIVLPVYTERYNYRLPDNHRLDMNLDYDIHIRKCALKLCVGAYNIYNQSNPSFVYFKPEYQNGNPLRLSPKSKVILPFIPYISFRLKF